MTVTLLHFQFGFRAQKSKTLALQCFTNDVLCAFDNKFFLSVFLDLSFDTINQHLFFLTDSSTMVFVAYQTNDFNHIWQIQCTMFL